LEVQGKKVLVVGVARSGVAASRLLASRRAAVTANDIRPESELALEAAELRELGVTVVTGSHPDALFENADLVVLSPGVPADSRGVEISRRRGIEIISEPELAGRFLKGKMIGITGSNGKTTTTTLIGELMAAAGAEVIVGGNIGTALSSLVERATERSWVVAELSSFQLETISSLRVQVAVMTNITPDHLDRHGTFENYVRAKHRIFRNQTAEDWAVLNARDQATDEMVSTLGIRSRRVYFSSDQSRNVSGITAGIFAEEGAVYASNFDASGPGGSSMQTAQKPVRNKLLRIMDIDEIPLRGMHNVENVMTSMAATFCAMNTRAEDVPALVEAVKRFKGVEHRIEFVAEINGVQFYNDSKATNVDSTVKALEAFARNVVVILGGKDKGSDYSVLEPLVRERVKHIVLIGPQARRLHQR
jgi:UDP-N-acetylmuramoylalanine--D-glutamate ligase